MRKLLAFVATALLLSACVADMAPEDGEVAEEVDTQGEALDDSPDTITGTPCCAKDYRDGNGELEVCGKRLGAFCCNEAKTECYNCSYYECEPPPEKSPIKLPTPIVKPPIGGFTTAP